MLGWEDIDLNSVTTGPGASTSREAVALCLCVAGEGEDEIGLRENGERRQIGSRLGGAGSGLLGPSCSWKQQSSDRGYRCAL